jgi:tRNA modification GTPase
MIPADTICAVATRAGGALSIIRVSGTDAIRLTEKIFSPMGGKPLSKRDSNSVTFGRILDRDGSVVDEVLVSLFRAPYSFTGEESTEISCHGSTYILQRINELLIDAGCRQALPGEYTQRAFLNGKMDLSQAEAVADLISSTSAATHRLAMNQMKGGFSHRLRELKEQLLQFTSLIELELDFSEEDVEFADRSRLTELATNIEAEISSLARSFQTGDAIKNGVPVAIIGNTNTGKSTLLNLLLDDNKAIVSDIQGTTRDSIEDTVTIDGVLFRFIDTAGIRSTTDVIESLGIERTFQKIDQAEIVLWLIDSTKQESEISELQDAILPRCKNKQLVRVFNKCDLMPDIDYSKSESSDTDIHISAKKRINIDTLKQRLLTAAALPEIGDQDIIVTNLRHYQALTQAQDSLQRVLQGLDDRISGDFLSQDIRECIHHLSDIIGEVTTEDVLQNIFAHFCIGK